MCDPVSHGITTYWLYKSYMFV